MMKSMWAPPKIDGDEAQKLRFSTKRLVARSADYERDTKDRPAGELPTPGTGESVRWTPLAPDIQDASELYDYLSPQVRRLAIAMEARSREPNGADARLQSLRGGRPSDDRAREVPVHERPGVLFNRMLAEARGLLEAVRNPNVTDRFIRPLPLDHPDRNPRRVLNVLREAANVGCYLLLIADVCGALEESATS
jgi:hypothetical protein